MFEISKFENENFTVNRNFKNFGNELGFESDVVVVVVRKVRETNSVSVTKASSFV